MFEGQRVFLDVRDYSFVEKLELDIQRLGGTVEKFLSRETTCVISNRENAVRDKDHGLRECTPSPSRADNHPTLLVSIDSDVDKVSNSALSRGQKLLMRSNSFKSNTKVSGTSCDPVQFARTWNIPIYSLNSAIKAVKSGVSQKSSSLDDKCRDKPAKVQVRQLLGDFLKIEDVDAHYRPFYTELPSFPVIKFCPGVGVSIFDTVKKVPKLPALCKETTENFNTKKLCVTPTVYKERGYCECCDVYYNDLKRHLRGRTHRQFAKNRVNFECLDMILTELSTVSLISKSTHQRLPTVYDLKDFPLVHVNNAKEISEPPVLCTKSDTISAYYGSKECVNTEDKSSVPLSSHMITAAVKDEAAVVAFPPNAVAGEDAQTIMAMQCDSADADIDGTQPKLVTYCHNESSPSSSSLKSELRRCQSKDELSIAVQEINNTHTSPVERVHDKSADEDAALCTAQTNEGVHDKSADKDAALCTAQTNKDSLVEDIVLDTCSHTIGVVKSTKVALNFELGIYSLKSDGRQDSENSALLSSDRVENILALLSSNHSQCDAGDSSELTEPLSLDKHSTVGETLGSVSTEASKRFATSNLGNALIEKMHLEESTEPLSLREMCYQPSNVHGSSSVSMSSVSMHDRTNLTCLRAACDHQLVESCSDIKETISVQLGNAITVSNTIESVTHSDEKPRGEKLTADIAEVVVKPCEVIEAVNSSFMEVSPSKHCVVVLQSIPEDIGACNSNAVVEAVNSSLMEVSPSEHSTVVFQPMPENNVEIKTSVSSKGDDASFSDISSAVDEGFEAVIDSGVFEYNQHRFVSVVEESFVQRRYDCERYTENKAVMSVASVDSAVVTDDLCEIAELGVLLKNKSLNEALVHDSEGFLQKMLTDEALVADVIACDVKATESTNVAEFGNGSLDVVDTVIDAATKGICDRVEDINEVLHHSGDFSLPASQCATNSLEKTLLPRQTTNACVDDVINKAKEADVKMCIAGLQMSHYESISDVQLVKMMDICTVSDMLNTCIPCSVDDTASNLLSLMEHGTNCSNLCEVVADTRSQGEREGSLVNVMKDEQQSSDILTLAALSSIEHDTDVTKLEDEKCKVVASKLPWELEDSSLNAMSDEQGSHTDILSLAALSSIEHDTDITKLEDEKCKVVANKLPWELEDSSLNAMSDEQGSHTDILSLAVLSSMENDTDSTLVDDESCETVADTRLPWELEGSSVNALRDGQEISENLMSAQIICAVNENDAANDDLMESELAAVFDTDCKALIEQRTMSTPAAVGTPELVDVPMEQEAYPFQLIPETPETFPENLSKHEKLCAEAFHENSRTMSYSFSDSTSTASVSVNCAMKSCSKWDKTRRVRQSAGYQSYPVLNDTTDVVKELELLEMLAARLVGASSTFSDFVSESDHCLERTLHDDLLMLASQSDVLNQAIHTGDVDHSSPALYTMNSLSDFPNCSLLEEDFSTLLDDCDSLSEITSKSVYELQDIVEVDRTNTTATKTGTPSVCCLQDGVNDVVSSNTASLENCSTLEAGVISCRESLHTTTSVFDMDCENHLANASSAESVRTPTKRFDVGNHKLLKPISQATRVPSAMSYSDDGATGYSLSATDNASVTFSKLSRSSRTQLEQEDVDVVTVDSPEKSVFACVKTNSHLLKLPSSTLPLGEGSGRYSRAGVSQPNFGVWQVISFNDLRIRLRRVANSSLSHAGIAQVTTRGVEVDSSNWTDGKGQTSSGLKLVVAKRRIC